MRSSGASASASSPWRSIGVPQAVREPVERESLQLGAAETGSLLSARHVLLAERCSASARCGVAGPGIRAHADGPAKHLGALRAWVRGEAPPLPKARTQALQSLPTDTDQQARAEFGLGRWLFECGRSEAAARHFERAGELAPHDFTIRRGTMPMRGIDPMGPAFREMLGAWTKAGNPYYRPLPE